MYRLLASVILLGALGISLVSAQTQKQEPKKESKAKSNSATMTGCIDEADGKYVLINDRTRTPIASLEPDGFEVEGFAKHVGHKVTVRGTVNPSGERPLFRVRSIETVSESCEPPLDR